jgi:hypothetical protein
MTVKSSDVPFVLSGRSPLFISHHGHKVTADSTKLKNKYWKNTADSLDKYAVSCFSGSSAALQTGSSLTGLRKISGSHCAHYARLEKTHRTHVPGKTPDAYLFKIHYVTALWTIQEVLRRTNRLPHFNTTRTSQKMTRPTDLLMLRVYSLAQERVYLRGYKYRKGIS